MSDAPPGGGSPALLRLLADDACVLAHGIEIESAGVGYARTTLTVTQAMTNGHGICHGGIVFMLADTAMAYASNAAGERTVSHSAHTVFAASASVGDILTAECREAYQKGRNGLYDVTVTNADGVVVAMVRGQTLRV